MGKNRLLVRKMKKNEGKRSETKKKEEKMDKRIRMVKTKLVTLNSYNTEYHLATGRVQYYDPPHEPYTRKWWMLPYYAYFDTTEEPDTGSKLYEFKKMKGSM